MTEDTEKLIRLRQELHSHAELAHREEMTMGIVKAFLREESDFRIVEKEGWFYAIKAGKSKKAVAFRAELDALPIPEEERTVSHRCGHDGHMAALCGAAAALKGITPERTVILVFQPAEETGEGGKACADELRTLEGLEEVYACHNRSGYPENSIICRYGLTQPASEGIRIVMTGKTSHASEPEKGNNPAAAISGLALYAVTLNQVKPMILSTGVGIRVGAGDFGISPGEGEICITVRAERETDMKAAEKKILAQAEAYAAEAGLSCRSVITDYFPETVNHDACVEKVLRAAKVLGKDAALMEEPWRASEDFGYYTKNMPGVMFSVGNGTDYPQLHTVQYEFNDHILGTITEMFLRLV